ncbi:DUF6611 family protein [Mycolicibacterium baixiangningiae]|uniref:DUF6611 family protein n=1 Tax=Mycolicibacterium baixiangningiae TaxID=2761578 RepID=UPI0018D0EADE|nr:DUF6611 family protein [Mycolicibacterium baixiangningiae]
MDGITSRRTLLTRAWHRLADGDAPWGAFDIWPDRLGTTRFRLTVYPPGISARERRLLRAWRGWPAWGGLLWAVGVIVMVARLSPGIALFVSTALFIGTGIATFTMVGDAGRRVRTAIASVTVGFYHPAAHREARHLQELARRLAAADIERRDGTLTPVAYEAVWWQVYNDLAADETDVEGRRHTGPAQR